MCDTFVACRSATPDGSVIFGKNSDREPNEAQVLEYLPPARFSGKDRLKTTYITIPQVEETYGVLLSRPFWMWGAEIGANQRGVVIGNEAVWTKMPLSKKGGLTGMDLLRLGLERGGTAQDALQVIIQLLADFGQGGICGYEDRKMTYHNSYIIADPSEAWVLETAAHLWAAKKVEDAASISNGLTLGEAFDLSHPDLIPTARKKGWLKKGETFEFARCFGDWFYTTFSASRQRRSRTLSLLGKKMGQVDSSYALHVLRDHGDAAAGRAYRPDKHFLGNRVCAHAANPIARKASQTTASLAAHLKEGEKTYWVTGTSAPCTGIFKPVWLAGDIPLDIGPAPGRGFDPDSLWWRHEVLHREVLRDFRTRLDAYEPERDEIERKYVRDAGEMKEASAEMASHRAALTKKAFGESDEAETRWLQKIKTMPISRKTGLIYRLFWNDRNRKASLPI